MNFTISDFGANTLACTWQVAAKCRPTGISWIDGNDHLSCRSIWRLCAVGIRHGDVECDCAGAVPQQGHDRGDVSRDRIDLKGGLTPITIDGVISTCKSVQ